MVQVAWQDLVAAVSAGESLISFPTDTVPALASRPDRADLIFAAKQRPMDKPLILMAATFADVWRYVAGREAERQIWQEVASRYWPGALTLVLPASDRLPPVINPTDPTTIGVRIPDHAIARAILQATGPLATTSVNRSGEPPLLTMTEIEQQFPDVLTLTDADASSSAVTARGTLDQHNGSRPAASGIPSTVVRWQGTGWQVLRQGAVTLDATLPVLAKPPTPTHPPKETTP